MARIFCGVGRPVIFALFCMLSACSGQHARTSELLDLAFVSVAGSAIELQSPGDNTAVGLNPTFVWSARNGALFYRLEISTTSDFSQLILDKRVSGTSYTVANGDLIGAASLDSIGYYWRVSVYPNNQLQSRTFTMQVVGVTSTSGGNFYVDASFDPSLTKTSYGNKSAPYRSINEGIISANIARNSNPNVQVNVLVSKGTYAEQVQMLPGISLLGGFDSSTWTRSVSLNLTRINAPADKAVTCATTISSSYSNSTVIDGFSISSSTVIAVTYGLYLYLCSIKVANNIIAVYSNSNTAATTQAYGIFNGFSNGVYTGNTIYSSARSSTAYGIYNAINSGSFGNNVVMTNNVIVASSGYSGAGLISAFGIYNQMFTLSTATISNNTIVYSGRNNAFGIIGQYNITQTNNLFVGIGNLNGRAGVSEAVSGDLPRSLENNIFYDGYYSSTGFHMFVEYTAAGSCTNLNYNCRDTLTAMENLTIWLGGNDKSRGNYIFPNTTAGSPFVRIPRNFEYTNATGTTTQLNFSSTSGFALNDYVEVNRDGIPRQIASLTGIQITLSGSTPLNSNSGSGDEVRNWSTSTVAANCFSASPNTVCTNLFMDFHLAQNALSPTDWNTVRYGGKNTAGNNCGAPAGGSGLGPGGETCGSVTTDRDGQLRTTGNASSSANYNKCPTAAATGAPLCATPVANSYPADVQGFSIGAYESD